MLIIKMFEKSYRFYIVAVASVREEFWVSQWLVSHAENVLPSAYHDCGHFNCYVVEVSFSMPSSLRMSKSDSEA